MVAVFAFIVLTSCVLLALTTKTELAPDEDQSVLFSSASAPAYANIDYLEKFTKQFDKIFSDIPYTVTSTSSVYLIVSPSHVLITILIFICRPSNELQTPGTV